jgi:hypothetical protein
MLGNTAVDYFLQTSGVILSINDMSLERGGVFDISGAWSQPHKLHREGLSVDVDRCANGVMVNQKILDQIAILNGGTRIVEKALMPLPCEGPVDTPRIHYDFK